MHFVRLQSGAGVGGPGGAEGDVPHRVTRAWSLGISQALPRGPLAWALCARRPVLLAPCPQDSSRDRLLYSVHFFPSQK